MNFIRLILFVLAATLGVSLFPVSAHAQEVCRAPATATREAPLPAERQSFSGTVGQGDLRHPTLQATYDEISIPYPEGTQLEIEVVLRYEGFGDAFTEFQIELSHDALGAPDSIIGRNNRHTLTDRIHWFDGTKDIQEIDGPGLDRVSVTLRGILNTGVVANTSLKLWIVGIRRDITYIVRTRSVVRGDAGTRFDSGDTAEYALNVPIGETVTGQIPFWNPGVFISGFDDPADEPVVVNEGRGNVVSVSERDSWNPFSADFSDVYRLPRVEPGTKLSARIVSAENFTGSQFDTPDRGDPDSLTIEILEVVCSEDGEVYLAETIPPDEAFYDPGPEDDYLTRGGGEHFVRISGGGPVEYTFRVDTKILPYLVHLPKPKFKLVTAHFPEKPVIAAPLHMAFRLRNLPDYRVTGVTMDFQFFNPKTNDPLEDIETDDKNCQFTGAGSFRCDVGEIGWGGHKEALFFGPSPPEGVRWFASWDSDEGVEGLPAASGIMGADTGPRIKDIYVLSDQKYEQAGIPSHTYPFNERGREGPDFRTLFITGWKLPQQTGDEIDFGADDPNLEYRFVAWPDSDNLFHKENYERGWQFYRRDKGLAGNVKLPNGLQGLVVRANLREGIMPGPKELVLNDAAVPWELHFGGLNAELNFVNTDLVIPTDNTYAQGFIEVEVASNVVLPVTEIPIVVFEDHTNKPSAVVHRLMARVRPELFRGRQRFRTQRILLADSTLGPRPSTRDNDIVIPVSAGRPVRLRAEIDSNYRLENFTLPVIPEMADVLVLKDPLDEPIGIGLGADANRPGPRSLFHKALQVAAACKDITVANWDSLDLQSREADYFWNVVVLEFFDEEVRTEPVKIGHHAIALLLRELFVQELDSAVRDLDLILAQDVEIAGVLARMSLHFSDRNFPINRIEVKGPDGSTVEYGEAVAFDSLELLAKQFGLGTGLEAIERIAKWRFDATKEALGKLAERTREIALKAREPDACDDIKDLVRMTGIGFDSIKDKLSPKLRSLEIEDGGAGGRSWQHDLGASSWLTDMERLMRRVKEQEAAANRDSALLIGMFGLLSAPVSAGFGELSVYISVGFGLVDLGVTGYLEIRDYLKSQAELDFSEKAGIVLGFERNAEAEREAKSFAGVLSSVGLSAFFVGVDGIEIIKLARSAKPVVRGMQVTQSLKQRGINSLSQVERRHFATFAMRSKLREVRLGTQSLTELEQQALRKVDELAEDSAITAPPPAPKVGDVVAVAPADNLQFRLSPAGRPAVQPVAQPKLQGAGDFVAQPRAPPNDLNATQVFIDEVPKPLGGSGSGGGHAGHRSTAKELGKKLEGEQILFRRVDGRTETVELGRFIGGGATSAVFDPAEDVAGIMKVTLDTGGHRAAAGDAFGEAVIKQVDSPHLRLPDEYETFGVIPAAKRSDIMRVARFERVEPVDAMFKRTGREALNNDEIKVLGDALSDLNAAGYAWLDMKIDNFAFVRAPSGDLQVVVIDAGAIVKVSGRGSDAAGLARQAQLLVNGPFDKVVPGFSRVTKTSFRTGLRREDISALLSDSIDLDAMEGIDIWRHIGFTPAGGEQLEGFGEAFFAR